MSELLPAWTLSMVEGSYAEWRENLSKDEIEDILCKYFTGVKE